MQSSVNFDGENLGRAGIGVVFSRKNLKAITFFPTHKERTSYNPQDLGRLSEMVDKMEARQIPRSLISYANKNGWCAINGFQDRVDGRLWALEGQKPLLPSIALGANLGLFDPKHINPIIVACSELGLDPFSCGVLLLWLADKGTVDPLRTLESIAYGKGFAMDLPAKVPASFYKIGNLELAPFDLRALPPQALLASLGDDTIVFPCLIHVRKYGATFKDEQMNKMSFGSYLKRIPDKKTDFDWLSRDPLEVKKYIDDPLCGFVCTSSFYADIIDGIAYANNPKKIMSVPKDLPLLFISGDCDPVGAYGKGVRKSFELYKDAGISDVGLTLVPGARHVFQL